MPFVLTLVYIALSLVSVAALPEALIGLRLNLVIGVLVILSSLPGLAAANLTLTPDALLLAGLLFASALSSAATGWIGSALTTFLGFVPILFTFYFVAVNCRSLKRMKILVTVLVCIAFFVFANGLMAYHAGNYTSKYLEPEGVAGNMIYRFCGMGVLADPNDLAQYFVTLIPLLWLRWKKGKFLGNFLFTLLPAAILAVGVFSTHSRGGSIALIAVLLFGCKDKLGLVKSSILAGGALALVMVANVSGGRALNDDDGGRIGKWYVGLQIFKSHPLFGVGVDNFANYDDLGQTAHNSYVLSLAEEGLVGYFFWMGLLVSNWTGLSGIVRLDAARKKEIAAGSESESDFPPSRGYAHPQPWQTDPATNQFAASGTSAAAALPGYVRPAAETHPAQAWAPAWAQMEDGAAGNLPDDDMMAHYAKTLRVSMVGFLIAAFFLSRTYSMTLYVLLGMTTAMKTLTLEKYPDSLLSKGPLMKRIGLIILASIAVLYLVVRFEGSH